MKKDIIIISIIILLLFAVLTVIIIKKEVRNKNIEKLAAKFLLEPYEENTEENGDDLYLAQRPDDIDSINKQNQPQNSEQKNNKSEMYSEKESYKENAFSYELVAYDNYAYVATSSNTNPDLLLQGDVITAINDHHFNGLPFEKIDEILDSAIAECEKNFYVKRNNKNLIVHTSNANCSNNFNYDVKIDIYDNYAYVSQSSNPYYDRLLMGDIIISADDYNFQGLSAKEIHNIWQSLKNKKNIYCKVKRGNEIITIVKGF